MKKTITVEYVSNGEVRDSFNEKYNVSFTVRDEESEAIGWIVLNAGGYFVNVKKDLEIVGFTFDFDCKDKLKAIKEFEKLVIRSLGDE